MIILKTNEEIEILKEGGKRLVFVLHEVAKKVAPGVSTKELDEYAEELIRENGDEPAFLNYSPDGDNPYPASLCVSINDQVVHGIPARDRIIKKGDIVSLDLGLKHGGLYTDMAITVPVGKVDKEALKLINITKEALMVGIKAATLNGRVGDIGYAIEQYAKPYGYGIVRILSGHGVGKHVHEDPYVPNYGKKGTGEKLVAGMVIALEPMFNLGGDQVVLDRDDFTYRTRDGSLSAHFEHTIAITDKGIQILTQ